MELSKFVKCLCERKKLIMGAFILGFFIFALFSYFERDSVNEGLIYCSDATIMLKDNGIKATDKGPLKNDDGYRVSRALATSDEVLMSIQEFFKKENIYADFEDIRKSLAVESRESGTVIKLYATNADKEVVQEMCQIYADGAVNALKKYTGKEADIINSPTNKYTAVLTNVDDNENPGETIARVTPQEKVEISGRYIVKQMVKYGILGGILFFALALLGFSIKVLLKEC